VEVVIELDHNRQEQQSENLLSNFKGRRQVSRALALNKR